jgi:hypothetical protein
MSGKKTIPGQQIRNTWSMNPVTRVHDHDPSRSKKKARQNARKTVEKELNMFLYGGRHERKCWTDYNSDQRFLLGVTTQAPRSPVFQTRNV